KIQDWQAWVEGLEKHLEELEQYELRLQRMEHLKNALPLHQKMNQVIAEGKRLGSEIGKLYSGTDIHSDCGKLKDNWTQVTSQLSNLQAQQQELQKEVELQSGQLQELEKDLKAALSKTSFTEISAARAALLSDPEVLRLQTERDSLKQQYQNFKNKLDLLSEQLSQKQLRENPRHQDELAQELSTYQQTLADLQTRCEDLRHLPKNEENWQQEITVIKERMKTMEEGTRR